MKRACECRRHDVANMNAVVHCPGGCFLRASVTQRAAQYVVLVLVLARSFLPHGHDRPEHSAAAVEHRVGTYGATCSVDQVEGRSACSQLQGLACVAVYTPEDGEVHVPIESVRAARRPHVLPHRIRHTYHAGY